MVIDGSGVEVKAGAIGTGIDIGTETGGEGEKGDREAGLGVEIGIGIEGTMRIETGGEGEEAGHEHRGEMMTEVIRGGEGWLVVIFLSL